MRVFLLARLSSRLGDHGRYPAQSVADTKTIYAYRFSLPVVFLPPLELENPVTMQIISAQPLIEKFRSGTFRESEVGPYFMANIILTAAVFALPAEDLTSWEIAAGVASIVITIFGVLYLKTKNDDSFGNQFLAKYFSLGWVITVRMLILAIPLGVVDFGIASIVGGDDALDPAHAILVTAFEVGFYWWLGTLFEQSSEQTKLDRKTQN